jgi:flagellar biosynthesis/type III secretory pathway protein FliH
MTWERLLILRITQMGIDWEAAMKITGLVAEIRLEADREGYKRGYEDGHNSGYDKAIKDM